VFGAGGIAGQNQAQDLAVLGPHQRTLLRVIEHSTHRPFQMWPLRGDSVFDRAVAGQTVECRMKRDIGVDEREYRSIRRECKT